MQQGLFWVGVVVALAVVGFLVFGGGDSSGGNGSGTVGKGSEEDSPATQPGGPTLTTGAARRDPTTPRVPTELRGHSTIQGLVSRDGAPVAATVELRHLADVDPRDPFKGGFETLMIARMLDAHISSKEAIARDEAGGDGRFVFRGLAPGLYEIRATTGDGIIGFSSASIPAFGARVEATVEIPAGSATLVGRIAYADGRPFRGMAVATSAVGDNFGMLFGGNAGERPTPTSAEGRFRLGGLTPGKYQVSAILPGVLRAMGAPIAVPYEGEYTLTIQAGALEVKGKVLRADDEKPIANATIFGGGGNPSSTFSIFTTRSAPDGSFSITLPAGRGGGMFVKAEGFAPQMIDFQGGEQDVVVTMLALARLSGRVVAKEGGAPVAGVTVFAVGTAGRGMPPTPTTAITDADGRYVMDGVIPGAVSVHALGAGWTSAGLSGLPFGKSSTPYVIELEPGQEGTLDLEATAAGKVKGRVLDESGRGVPGAMVHAAAGGSDARAMAFFLGGGVNFGTVVTDADGAYEIDVLIPMTKYRVVARAPEHPEVQSDEFGVVAGEVKTFDLRLQAPRWLEVIVRESEGGKPVAGATVMAVSKDDASASIRLATGGGVMWTTGADGHARVGPLPDGQLRMGVTAPGYVKLEDQDVPEGQTGPLEFELQRGLVIAGRVVVPEGVPVQSVRVTVQRDSPTGDWFYESPAVQPDGSWKVDTIEDAGTYKIRGNGRWQDSRLRGEVSAESGTTDVELVLTARESEERNRVEVVVVDHDGKPVPAGRVQVWRFYDKNSTSTSRTRLSSGKAVFGSLRTEGELWVEVYEMIGSSRGATIEGPVTIDQGRIEVRLPPANSIAGRVTGPDGSGVAGVRLTARAVHPRSGTRRQGQEHAVAVSATDGRFELKGLGPLDYTLAYTVPSDFAPAASEVVHAGRKDVRIQLRTGLKATISVVDFAGNPVPGARVWCRPKESQGGHTGYSLETHTTDREGRALLAGLDPTTIYTITIHHPDSRADLKNLDVQDWKPGDGTFTLVQAFSIAGTVVDQHGKPLANVSVQARREGSKNWNDGWGRTDEGGAFRIENLEAGRYDLRAHMRGAMSPPTLPGESGSGTAQGVVTVRAGATGAKLVLDIGLALTVRVEGLAKQDVSGATVALQSQGGRNTSVQGTYVGKGTWKFQGLTEGTTYRLWIGGLPGGQYVLENDLHAQQGVAVVRPRQGGAISGTVRFPAGVKLQYAFVGASNGTGLTRQMRIDGDGRFSLDGLPEGTWTLSVNAWGEDRTRWVGQATATTGTTVTIDVKKK